jgi:imidazolonepropionase-like amidohydrolase
MRLVRFALPIVLCLPIGFAQQTPVFFEGARLVNGDGSVTEHSAFLIANGKFTSVGKEGAVKAPAGATRVDLAGKTVMPALVDTHVHLGW